VIERIQTTAAQLKEAVHQVIVGQDQTLDLLLVALLSGGHVLLEGVPGTAKTLLARTFARTLDLGFNRIQFTPDLMPGDVIGTNLFDFTSNRFQLTRGPVFTDLLLADEINRTPPKTQAALLQAMQERLVTIDGTTYDLGPNFMVVATQNPIEQEGTYPLPEAQLDRFLFKIEIALPSLEEERRIVRQHGRRPITPLKGEPSLPAVANAAALDEMRGYVASLELADDIADYVVDLVRSTRERPALRAGASPRAASMLASASRALAALRGRDFVLPDDIKELAPHTLAHRMVLDVTAEIEGARAAGILEEILASTPAPR